jgi:hypothetical protein
MTSSQKQPLPFNGYFLDNLRPHINRPRPSSKTEIYAWYHKKIAEKQAKRASELAIVFELIQKRISKLGVNWTDEVDQKIRDANIQQLSELHQDIMKNYTKEDAEFLKHLLLVLNYNPERR